MSGAVAEAPINLHGTMVVLGERGVLITGESGTGKSVLAQAMISHWRAQRLFASLVSDDQILPARAGSNVVAHAPVSIQGLAEARGFGVAPMSYENAAVIDLVVELVDAALAPRMADQGTATIAAVELPLLRLPRQNTLPNVMAIAAALAAPPFIQAHTTTFRRGGVAE